MNINLCEEIGRTIGSNNHFDREKDEWGYTHNSGIHIVGRIILNVWRIVRSEVATNIYTFGNIVYHVLHKRYLVGGIHQSTKYLQSSKIQLQNFDGVVLEQNEMENTPILPRESSGKFQCPNG